MYASFSKQYSASQHAANQHNVTLTLNKRVHIVERFERPICPDEMHMIEKDASATYAAEWPYINDNIAPLMIMQNDQTQKMSMTCGMNDQASLHDGWSMTGGPLRTPHGRATVLMPHPFLILRTPQGHRPCHRTPCSCPRIPPPLILACRVHSRWLGPSCRPGPCRPRRQLRWSSQSWGK